MVYGIWLTYTVYGYLRESKWGKDMVSDRRKAEKAGDQLECPHCGELADLLVTRKGRSMFLCHNCGLQCFSRGTESEKWFGKLVEKVREKQARET